MPDTPDRAALAERLREMLAEVRRTQRALAMFWFSTESQRDESLARSKRQAEALAAAIAALAAPALPPSVAEARDVVMRGAAQFGYASDADVDALIAAVRAATVAEAVRAVAAVPRYVLNLNIWQGTAPTMEPAANGAWVGQAEAMSALRALGGQP